MPVEHALQERRKTKDATRDLTPHGGQHELEVFITVTVSEHPGNDVDDVMVEGALLLSVFDSNSFRLPSGEAANIPSARPIDEWREGVEVLQFANDGGSDRPEG